MIIETNKFENKLKLMNKKLILIPLVTLVIFVIGYTYTGYFVFTNSRTVAIVAKVIDGDTIQLTDGTRVRMIGIDADERGGECYQEAKDRLRQLVESKNVVLEKDKIDKDKYGRLLRYVFVDNIFVNYILVREGLARVHIAEPNVKYSKQLEQGFLLARNESGCIWRVK